MPRQAAEPDDLEIDDIDEAVSEGLDQAEREAERRTGETIVDDDTGTGADTSGTDDEEEGTGDGADDLAQQLDDDTDAGAEKGGKDGEAAPITREDDGATWNDKAGRWQKDGKFVEGAAPEGASASGKKAAADATAAAGTKPGTDAATDPAAKTSTEGAKWEPFAVSVDRQAVAIPEAQVQKAGGFMFVGVPEAKWSDFQRRIVRGVAAERMWRGLQQERESIERERAEEKARPKVRTDSEVEADIMLEVLKPRLEELFEDARDVELLNHRIKDAQRAERDKLTEWESKRGSESTAAKAEEEMQTNGLAETLVEVAEQFPEFKDLTNDDLREVLHTYLMPVRRSLYYKEGDGWFRNTQYVYDRLKERVDATQRGASSGSSGSSGASGSGTTTGTDATPPKGGTTADAGKGTASTERAERLNRGHDTAAKPQTTNLKAGRGKAGTTGTPTRPSTEHHRDASPKDTRTKAQRDEDNFRKTTRGFLNSDSLDFDDEE